MPRIVLAIAAFLAFTVAGALQVVVVAFTVFLEAVRLLAVASSLALLEFHGRSVSIFAFCVVLTTHTLAQFVAFASWVNEEIPCVKHSQ
jgi:uncharacterized membrane protein